MSSTKNDAIKSPKKKRKRRKSNYSTVPAISPSSMAKLRKNMEYENVESKKESKHKTKADTDPCKRRRKASRASSLIETEKYNKSGEYKKRKSLGEVKSKKKKRDDSESSESNKKNELLVMIDKVEPVKNSNKTSKDSRNKRRLSNWFIKPKTKKQASVFGSSIAELVNDPNNNKEIPIIIRQCIDYLFTSDAHLLDGIFRKSGSYDVLEHLKTLYTTSTDEPDISFCEDPHCVASLLKQFLADMSEPVIPFSEYETVIQNYKHFKEENERTGVIRNLVSKIPETNRNVLLYLMKFLTRVSKNSEINKMTATNLGVVFAPTMLRPETHIPATLMDMTNTKIIAHMIDHYKDVFHRPN